MSALHHARRGNADAYVSESSTGSVERRRQQVVQPTTETNASGNGPQLSRPVPRWLVWPSLSLLVGALGGLSYGTIGGTTVWHLLACIAAVVLLASFLTLLEGVPFEQQSFVERALTVSLLTASSLGAIAALLKEGVVETVLGDTPPVGIEAGLVHYLGQWPVKAAKALASLALCAGVVTVYRGTLVSTLTESHAGLHRSREPVSQAKRDNLSAAALP